MCKSFVLEHKTLLFFYNLLSNGLRFFLEFAKHGSMWFVPELVSTGLSDQQLAEQATARVSL